MTLSSRNFLPWIIVGVASASIIGVGGVTYNAIFGESQLEQFTVLVEEESLRVRIRASGTVTPFQSVNISPKRSGILRELRVEQGMEVEAGQELAIMDNGEVQAQVLQAQANLRQAAANGEASTTEINSEIAQARARVVAAAASIEEAGQRIPTEINEAQVRVGEAEIRFRSAEARFQRYDQTQDTGAISTDTYENAGVELAAAQAELVASREALKRAVETRTPELNRLRANLQEAQINLQGLQSKGRAEIVQLEEAAKAAQAQFLEAQIRRADTVIRAPFKGIITQRYATPGAFITPTTSASATASATSTSILAIARGLEILANVPEVDVGRLAVRQPVEIVADAFPDKVFRGAVRLIAPEAVVEDNVTSFEVKVFVDPNQTELKSGMNVDVTFVGEPLAMSTVIPTVAIVIQDGEQGVMVADDNDRPEFRPVVLGATLDDKTQVIRGLEPGERIFVELPPQYQRRLDRNGQSNN
ncbi:MAG: efflux RND transporter periplasmic adaptor subunit [Cyanobacteria bacterium P01_E01_bin.42]